MTAQERSALGTRPVLGAALLALGTSLLLSKVTLLFTDTWSELVGALPAIGMALLRASTTLPFAGHGLFALAVGVLVSFWPLILIAVGAALLIPSQAAGKRRISARG